MTTLTLRERIAATEALPPPERMSDRVSGRLFTPPGIGLSANDGRALAWEFDLREISGETVRVVVRRNSLRFELEKLDLPASKLDRTRVFGFAGRWIGDSRGRREFLATAFQARAKGAVRDRAPEAWMKASLTPAERGESYQEMKARSAASAAAVLGRAASAS